MQKKKKKKEKSTKSLIEGSKGCGYVRHPPARPKNT